MTSYYRFITTPQDNPRDEALRIIGAIIPISILAILLIVGIFYAAIG